MNTMKLRMKQEAIKRLAMLNLHPNVLPDFVNEELIHVSEHQNVLGFEAGILYWANNEQLKCISDFEERTGALVYHAILTPFIFGECLSLLYISPDENEWEQEREELERGVLHSYVYNLTDPNCSEAGYIAIQEAFGGLIRTA